MSHLNFFENTRSSGEHNFQQKLRTAIKLIEQNQSLIAMKVLKVIHAGDITISSSLK